ncbi:MAG: hypothetical protein FJZ47_05320 [Candidatus Tectomicrobia bacterium]|uniref:Uncharacterized protein n=1 Tax=Tectimicrobiota bacterium TaxID=2528274 RepID=A0A938B009_UNCTE|nr:hypothetical protein [Candidatus Tectomicrobia bacterium]
MQWLLVTGLMICLIGVGFGSVPEPANDWLRGGPGMDSLFGADGDDGLQGDADVDTCSGDAHMVGDVANSTCETIFTVP